MRKIFGGLCGFIIAMLVISHGEALAAMNWSIGPNSGRCPGNLRRVYDLRNCARIEARLPAQQQKAMDNNKTGVPPTVVGAQSIRPECVKTKSVVPVL
jgi:hypothetical protein